MEYLKELNRGLNKLKDKFTKTDLQCALKEVTSNEHCHANVSLLDEIAYKSNSYNDFQVIVEHISKRLNCRKEKWRKILKTLFLIEHLLKTGSPNFIDSVRSERYKLQNLNTFSYIDENRADKGETIREKSRMILTLIDDGDRLREERENYSKWKNRITGVASSGGANWDEGNRYGSTSSNSCSGGGRSYVDRPYESSYSTQKDDKSEKKKKKKKKDKDKEKKESSSSESSSSSSDGDEDKDKDKEKKKKKKKKKKKDKEKDKPNEKEKEPQSSSNIAIKRPGEKKPTKTDLIESEPVKANQSSSINQDIFDLFGGGSTTTLPQQNLSNQTNSSSTFDFFSPKPSTTQTTTSAQPLVDDLFSIGSQPQPQSNPGPINFNQPQSTGNKADDLLQTLSNLNKGTSQQFNQFGGQTQPNQLYHFNQQSNQNQPSQPQYGMNNYQPQNRPNTMNMNAGMNLGMNQANFNFAQPSFNQPQPSFDFNMRKPQMNQPQPSFTFPSQPQPKPQPKANQPQTLDDDFTEVKEDNSTKSQPKTGLSSLLDSKLVNLDNLNDTKPSSHSTQSHYSYY